MSSKRRLRRNGCAGKVAYRKLSDALSVVRAMRHRGAQLLGAYLCPIRSANEPRHYHVGHRVNALRAYVP